MPKCQKRKFRTMKGNNKSDLLSRTWLDQERYKIERTEEGKKRKVN